MLLGPKVGFPWRAREHIGSASVYRGNSLTNLHFSFSPYPPFFSLFSSLRRDPVRDWIEYRLHISANHDEYGFTADQARVVDLILASPSRWWQVVLPIAGCPYLSFSHKYEENRRTRPQRSPFCKCSDTASTKLGPKAILGQKTPSSTSGS